MLRDNTNDIVAFLAMARQCSFTKATAERGLSQSALDHSIHAQKAMPGLRLQAGATGSIAVAEPGEWLMRGIHGDGLCPGDGFAAPSLKVTAAYAEGVTP